MQIETWLERLESGDTEGPQELAVRAGAEDFESWSARADELGLVPKTKATSKWSNHPLRVLLAFPRLRRLGVYELEVDDIAPLEGLEHLEHLTLSTCAIKRMTHLKKLTGLRVLRLPALRSGKIPPLGKDLEAIDLRNVGKVDPAMFGPAKALRVVLLPDSGVRFIGGMPTLPRLEVLDLSDTGPFAGGLKPLERCKSLRAINLNRTKAPSLDPLLKLRKLNVMVAWNHPDHFDLDAFAAKRPKVTIHTQPREWSRLVEAEIGPRLLPPATTP